MMCPDPALTLAPNSSPRRQAITEVSAEEHVRDLASSVKEIYVVTLSENVDRHQALLTSIEASVFCNASVNFVTSRPSASGRVFRWQDASYDPRYNKKENTQDCFLGHQAAFELAVQQGKAPFLVVEDDVVLHELLPSGKILLQDGLFVTQSLAHQRMSAVSRPHCSAALYVASTHCANNMLQSLKAVPITQVDGHYFSAAGMLDPNGPVLCSSLPTFGCNGHFPSLIAK